jgi:hypothetical protein
MGKNTTYTGGNPEDWSDPGLWSNGLPADGDNVTIADDTSFDDLTSVTSLASVYLDVAGDSEPPGNPGIFMGGLEILIPSLYITNVTAAYPWAIYADAIDAGAPVTVTVGTIAATYGTYGAQGTGGVFLDQSAVDQGNNYAVAEGGFFELWAAPASTSILYFGNDFAVRGGTLHDNPGGTIALKTPAASNAALLALVGRGDVLELPGTLVKNVSLGSASLSVTTNAGLYSFTNVTYQADTVDGYTETVNGYSASFDASTGLVAVTFTTGPAITGAVAGQPVEEGSNIAPFAGLAITDAYPDQTETVTVSLSDPANGSLYDLGGGTYDAATGVYSVTGTTLAVTAAIDALRFASTAHQTAPSKSVTTDFTISVTDTVGATETNAITSVIASYPAVPAPYTASDPDGYVSLAPIDGNDVVTTDQNVVTVAGSTDAQAGASIVTVLVAYSDDNGTPVAGNNAVAGSAPAAITDAGYKDANGHEVSSFSSNLSTAGLPPGLYVAESFVELDGQTTPIYAGGGPDGQRIISVDPTNQQNTILQLAGTNATLTADGQYLIYTAINEYNEPEITGDVYARNLLTGAEQNLTEEGLTNLPYADAVNHDPMTVAGNGSLQIDYPTFTSANGAYTYGAINNFDFDRATGNYDPQPVVTDNAIGYESVIGGIGTQKEFVGAPVAASDNGDVVLSENLTTATYQSAGSAYIENPDPQIYITYIGPAPSLTINPVNADNHIASNATSVTISGTSDANGQTVVVQTGGDEIGQAVVSNGTWSFIYHPATLPATSLALQASVTGADGTPAESLDTATIIPGPTITGFTAAADGYGTVLGPDQTLTITLDSSIPVDVTGALALLLSNGAQAQYLGGSGTGQLEFAYTTQISDSGATDLTVTGLSLAAGGAIEDSRGDALTGSAVDDLGFSLQTAPVIYDLSPSSQDSDFLTNSFAPQVLVSAGRNETVSLYDGNVLVGSGIAPDYGYPGITYVEIAINPATPLPEGISELIAIASDASGTSAPSSVEIDVDTIPPPETISGLTINTGDFVSLADQQNLNAVITGTLSGAIGAGDSIVLALPGGNSEIVTPDAGATSFSFTVPAFQAEFFGASGSVSASIEDAAGNIGPATAQSYTAAAIRTITLLSADPAAPLQAEGNGPAISGNGSIVAFFGASASYGGAGVTQGVYVQDLATGAVTLAAAGGADASLSDSGTELAYDAQGQVYVENLTTGKVTTVSVDDVNPANAAAFGSGGPSISADGREIAFVSSATDLVRGVTATGGQVYVATLSSSGVVTGMSLASVAQSGGGGASSVDGAYTDAAAISGAGSEVVFASSATNLLAPNDPANANLNGENQQIYVKALTDNAVTGLQAGQVELVSGLADGTVGDGNSDSDGVSANGRYVVFTSTSDNLNPVNLAPGATLPPGVKQVYVKDLVTGNISLVSLNASGVPGDGSVTYASISADGGTIVFSDNADNLFQTPLNPAFEGQDGQLFAATMVNGQVERLTLLSEAGAVPGNDPSTGAVVSDAGGMVAFASNSENLAANSPGGYVNQVYVTPGPTFTVQTLVVTNLLDSGAGSLRAVAAAAQGGDIVTFAANIDGGTIQLSTPVNIAGGVTINGTGSGITVAGSNAAPDFSVQTPGGLPATIIGLTIENGNGISGVVLQAGTIVFSNDAFTGDTASDGDLDISFAAGSDGLARIDTGTLSLTGTLRVGDAGAGSLAVGGNGLVTAAQIDVGAAGIVDVLAGGVVEAGLLHVAAGGAINLQGGVVDPPNPITIDAGGAVTGFGTLSGDVENNGILQATLGAVAILDTVSGTGTIAVKSNGTLLLDGVIEPGQTVDFAGTGATLALGPNAALDAPVFGFGAGDVLELPGSVAPGVTFGADSLTIATSNGPLVLAGVHVGGITTTYNPATGLESISFATGISLSGTSTETTIPESQTETGGTFGIGNTSNSAGGWTLDVNGTVSGGTAGLANTGSLGGGWSITGNGAVYGGTDGAINSGNVTSWDVSTNSNLDGGTDGAANTGTVNSWDVRGNINATGTVGSGVSNAGTVTNTWDVSTNSNLDGGTDGVANTGTVNSWDVKANSDLIGISGSGASNTGTVSDGWDVETNQYFSGGTAGISNARLFKADVFLNRRFSLSADTNSNTGGTGDVAGGWTIAGNATISGGADGISNDGIVTGGWTIADNGTISGGTGDGIINSGTVAGGWTIAENGIITGGNDGFSNTGTVAGGWTLAQTGRLSGGTDGVFDSFGGGLVTNQGGISGQAGAGIRLANGGVVNNLAGANILGDTYGVFIGNGGTVTNAGTIAAAKGLAVDFTGTGSNRLVVDPGAVFLGNAAAGPAGRSTLELASASTAGTLFGLGVSFAGFGDITLDAGADWTLAGASTLGTGQSLADYGSLTAAGVFTNDGLIITDPSVMIFDSAVTGTGTIEIGAGSDVVFFGSVASTETIVFLDSSGTLTINDPAEFEAEIVGTGHEDIACFYPGTRIATPTGTTNVEALRAGDLVSTENGPLPIRWVGQSQVSTRFADPLRALPIRVRAGALGGGLPSRDLLLSPDHAIFIDNMLVQAAALVNGDTIVRDAAVPEIFTYYHVELSTHELLLAEGVPAESFVDNVDRMHFSNWDERETPRAPIAEMAHPRVKSARQLPPAVHRRLAGKVAA